MSHHEPLQKAVYSFLPTIHTRGLVPRSCTALPYTFVGRVRRLGDGGGEGSEVRSRFV